MAHIFVQKVSRLLIEKYPGLSLVCASVVIILLYKLFSCTHISFKFLNRYNLMIQFRYIFKHTHICVYIYIWGGLYCVYLYICVYIYIYTYIYFIFIYIYIYIWCQIWFVWKSDKYLQTHLWFSGGHLNVSWVLLNWLLDHWKPSTQAISAY